MSQLQNSLNKEETILLELSRMVVAINLKFEHMTFRIEELGNGDSASINRSRIDYHSHGTNFFQTNFSKFNFPKFEGKNPSEWIYKCDNFFKINGIGDQEKVGLASLHLEGRVLELF